MGALLGFSKDKALGSWEFVKDEVMNFFREFYEHGRFVKSLNATFLVLIPEKMKLKTRGILGQLA